MFGFIRGIFGRNETIEAESEHSVDWNLAELQAHRARNAEIRLKAYRYDAVDRRFDALAARTDEYSRRRSRYSTDSSDVCERIGGCNLHVTNRR